MTRIETVEEFQAWAEGGRYDVLIQIDGEPGPALIWQDEDGGWHGVRPVTEDDGDWDGLSEAIRSTLAVPVSIETDDADDFTPLTVLYDPSAPVGTPASGAPMDEVDDEDDEHDPAEEIIADVLHRRPGCDHHTGGPADCDSHAMTAVFELRLAGLLAPRNSTPGLVVTREAVEAAVRSSLDKDYVEVFYDHDEAAGYSSIDDLIETVAERVAAALGATVAAEEGR